MSDQAAQVPLIESLERVPEDARVVYEHSPTEHSFIPVGRYCREAAAALRAKDERIAQLGDNAIADQQRIDDAEQRAEGAEQEVAKLKTVMVAAAEEIHEHWDAHCDAEGYGPANLMHRLEEGIPSEYGYTAGAFAELKHDIDRHIAIASAETQRAERLAGAIRSIIARTECTSTPMARDVQKIARAALDAEAS